jgi:DNA-binding GntR family transcriptional regulator
MLQEETPDRSALSDRVYQLLKTWIIDLKLGPGERLQVDKLAGQFGVSPTPVREALNRLSAEGIVSAAAYRGFHVSPLLSAEDLALLLTARRVIETAAVAMAPAASTPRDLHDLSDLVAAMDRLNDAEVLDAKTFNATDAAFHRLTVALSGNRFLLNAFDSLHAHVQIARHYQGRSLNEARRANIEHHRLLAAFVKGDGRAAAREARLHIEGVLARLQDRPGEEQAEALVEGVAQ